MESGSRLAFETYAINRAQQHDLVLFGIVTYNSALVFRWRAKSETMGPEFDDRTLAIDWIAQWLDNHSRPRQPRTEPFPIHVGPSVLRS